MTHPKAEIGDKTAEALCAKITQAIRKEGRPLRRGELAFFTLEAETRLLAACRYGIRHGILVRVGEANNARYTLPDDFVEKSDLNGVQQDQKEVP